MKRLFTLILILFCFAEVNGQIMWEKTVPTANQQGGFGEFVIRDSLIFIWAGGGLNTTNIYGGHYACYSVSGRPKWAKPVFTTANLFPYRHVLTQGDFLIHVGSNPGTYPNFAEKIYTQKISTITGDTLTRKYINTTAFTAFGIQSGILNDPDGGYTIAGESIIKLASVGWAGKRKSSIIKLDSSQNLMWVKHYGPGTFLNTHGLMRNNKGNYILGGDIMHVMSPVSTWHPFVFEIKPNGDSLRRKTIFLENPAFRENTAYSQDFINTQDGGYVFYGSIDSTGTTVNDYLYYVAKVDSLNNLVWLYKNTGQFENYVIKDVQKLPDGSFVLLSGLESSLVPNYFIIRISSTGQYISHQQFRSNICNSIYLVDFEVLPDSSAILTGGGCGGNKAYLARIANVLAPTVIKGASEEFNKNSKQDLTAFPNPVTKTVTFTYDLPPKVQLAEIKIYEIATGKLVIQLPLKTFEKQVQVSLANLRSGMYTYTFFLDSIPVNTKKLVVVK